METVTISKTEYEKLIKEKNGGNYGDADFGNGVKRKPFKDVAFGILKNTLGKRSSALYVSKLRESWRQ